MAIVTLSIPDDLKREMDRHSGIKWSDIFRNMIIKKAEQFIKLKEKGEL
jgi:hypothetical protein